MASRYTYEQFQKAAQDSGLWGQFSQADLLQAQKNPDFGMSILKYKNDYRNATTDAEREAANRGANELRSSWGGYTGGGDGGSFALNPMSPGSFEYASAPTYESRYDDTNKRNSKTIYKYRKTIRRRQEKQRQSSRNS